MIVLIFNIFPNKQIDIDICSTGKLYIKVPASITLLVLSFVKILSSIYRIVYIWKRKNLKICSIIYKCFSIPLMNCDMCSNMDLI
ncbi:UNVERIFIED_CONTAM: hypothetical protein RMT77_019425 [Armadillidium vulgare]